MIFRYLGGVAAAAILTASAASAQTTPPAQQPPAASQGQPPAAAQGQPPAANQMQTPPPAGAGQSAQMPSGAAQPQVEGRGGLEDDARGGLPAGQAMQKPSQTDRTGPGAPGQGILGTADQDLTGPSTEQRRTGESVQPGQTGGTAQNRDAPRGDDAAGGTDRSAGGSVEITTEEKTTIQQTIVQQNVEPVDIDVRVSVGATVPQTVELHPLPPRIVEIVPEYRGYRYILLADGRILIIEPRSYEIVYVLVV